MLAKPCSWRYLTRSGGPLLTAAGGNKGISRRRVNHPVCRYTSVRGNRVGLNWRIPVVKGKRAVRNVVFDTNYWKSFVHARFAVAMGDPAACRYTDVL